MSDTKELFVLDVEFIDHLPAGFLVASGRLEIGLLSVVRDSKDPTIINRCTISEISIVPRGNQPPDFYLLPDLGED